MMQFFKFIGGFFDCRHSTKARIFVSSLVTTLVIATSISLFWFQKIITSTTDTIVDNMEMSTSGGLAQLENSFEDIKQMHSTVIYDTDSLDYLIRDTANAPALDWFSEYNRLYGNLRTLGVTLSRTITGTGVYKADGTTCINGTMSLPENFYQWPEADRIRQGGGANVMFYIDKPRGERQNEVKKYFFVGRSILDKGVEKAIIVSKFNETLLLEAFRDTNYPNGFVLLTDAEHSILYDSSPDAYSEYKEAYLAQLREGYKPVAAAEYTIFHKTSAHTGVTVISSMSNRYIQESNRAVSSQLALLLVASVLVVALTSMLISGMITRRLQNLEKNMLRVGDGSMGQMLPVHGSDEVGRLSDTFLEMIGQIQGLMADIKENERHKREMEIKVLRAQISPHFLYNSLNTINYLALMQNAQNIHILVSSLIRLLQAAVDVDEVLVPIADEVTYVESYLNIQQYRFPQQIHVEYLLDDASRRLRVPKMILQPIVENALIHGFREHQDDASIVIRVYTMEPRDLIISVTDNGVGMSDEKIRLIMEEGQNQEKLRFSGIGIRNVDTRIKLQFGEGYGLSVFSREGLFTRVDIRLPALEETESEVGGAAR